VWGEVSPPYRGRDLGRGLWPLHRKCLDFGAQNDKFCCILGANFITVKLPVWTLPPVDTPLQINVK